MSGSSFASAVSRRIGRLAVASAVITLTACQALSQALAPIAAADLTRWWDAHHVSAPVSPLVTHKDVVAHVTGIVRKWPSLFTQDVIGQSVEGRALHHVAFGRGRTHILLWSQMHGDEPTATSALFDVHTYIAMHQDQPQIKRLLDTLTIHTVPMLNPDGAERYQRRNAQEIDINRDALRLQTPEGRALKALRDRLDPVLGFNLHNQNWRTSVGTPPRPASISLLAVAHDEARSDNPRRILAKKTASVIREALEPFAKGQIGRYSDEFEVRAFGDNVARWGTGVVLIETGPWPDAQPDPPLIRLNFIALMTALDAIASKRVEAADPKVYESLPMNESQLLHTLISNAIVINGSGVAPFTGDLGIAASRVVRRDAGGRTVRLISRIEDFGDLRVYGAMNRVDATGLTAAPAFAETTVGAEIKLPDWKAYKGPTLHLGQPGRVLLLKPIDASAGSYRVERIVDPQ